MLRALIVGLCLLAQPAVAGQLEDGRAALRSNDFATAMQLLRPLAEQGDAAAQASLASMYYLGLGVPQDYVETLKWLRRAAAQGDASAQEVLGFMYSKGEGVPQDYVQAHMWFNLAAAGSSNAEVRAEALKNRISVAAFMTPDQIAEAQRLAQEWIAVHPKP